MDTMLIVLVIVIVIALVAAIGIGGYLMTRRARRVPAQAPPPSPWAQAPGALQPAPPLQGSVYVPPTVERPTMAPTPPAIIPAAESTSRAAQTPIMPPGALPVSNIQYGQQFSPPSQPAGVPNQAALLQPASPPPAQLAAAQAVAHADPRMSYFGPTPQPTASAAPTVIPGQAPFSPPAARMEPSAAPAPVLGIEPYPVPSQAAAPAAVSIPFPQSPEQKPAFGISTPSSLAPQAPVAAPAMRYFTKKMILIGDGGVGKTTLIRKFVYDMFDDKYIATIGTKVSKKKIVFPDTHLDINLMVWDVQGQRNDPLLTRYFTGAEGALFVCDVTRFQTFENLPEWIKDFEAVCGKVPMIFLGNKADLVDNAQFGESELNALADRYNAKSFLTSAKTGANVEKSFKDLASAITTK